MIVTREEQAKREVQRMEQQISDMSKQEMRELLLINTYKLALARAQIEAISEVMINRKLTTYEELWKKTDKNFKNSTT